MQYQFYDATLNLRTDGKAKFEGQVKKKLLLLEQVHGDEIVVSAPGLDWGSYENVPPKADGWLVTKADIAKFAFGIKTADCHPVIVKGKESFALLHCGWRSAVKGILGRALKLLAERGENLSELEVHIGPGAQSCCYEIGAETADIFLVAESKFGSQNSVVERDQKIFGDIQVLLKAEAEFFGVCESRISLSSDCTICNLKYFSFRREKDLSGRQLSAVF